jgi:hypothetical protein
VCRLIAIDKPRNATQAWREAVLTEAIVVQARGWKMVVVMRNVGLVSWLEAIKVGGVD